MNSYIIKIIAVIVTLFFSCQQKTTDLSAEFIVALEKHLKAVSEKNIEILKNTLSEKEEIYLILPGSEPVKSNEGFLKMHKDWFQDTTWTFETQIIHTEIQANIGTALVEVMYKEPDRNGKPYFNKMAVSYTLKKLQGQWYIIMDHASSIEKTVN